MRRFLFFFLAACGLVSSAGSANAQDERWYVGEHPDYHVALVKQVDEVGVAIYVSKEPSGYLSPVLMETEAAPCGEKKPISMHATEALLIMGETAEQRALEVHEALDTFFGRARSNCNLAANLEERFFNRFQEAYAAADAILVEAGIFPLKDDLTASSDATEEMIEEEVE